MRFLIASLITHSYDDLSGMNKAIPRPYNATIKPFLKLRWGFTPEAETVILDSLKVTQAAIDGAFLCLCFVVFVFLYLRCVRIVEIHSLMHTEQT